MDDRKPAMALFSSLRKLLGFVLAMLVVVTSIQPAQARSAYAQVYGPCGVSNPASADPSDSVATALYISEESEEQSGCKSRSQRLGSNDVPLVAVGASPASVCSAFRYVPPCRAAHSAGGLFFSPLKTGPPSV